MKTYKIHWLDGTESIVMGDNIAQAMTLAGYSNGATRAIDWWEEVKSA